jgi:hypothetical protein
MSEMANKVYIDDEHVAVCVVDGDQTLSSVTAMGNQIKDALAQLKAQQKPVLLVDDIRTIGKVPPSARDMVVSLAKTLQYDRLAMLGKGGVLRFGANLLIRASGRGKKMHYFTDEQQARKWLQAA